MKRLTLFASAIALTFCGILALDRCPAGDPTVPIHPADEPAEIPAELLSEFLIDEKDADSSAAVIAAIRQYLAEIDDIERIAADQKAQARARLIAALERSPQASVGGRFPGLVGGSTLNGADARYVFEYQHGMLFDRELVWQRFHDGDTGPFPGVAITLQGFVEVPNDMTVLIRNAGGGVNQDWAELYLNDHLIGRVGDDVAKKSVYVVELPQGTHRVRWELTAGTFQHCLLKFEDPRGGELLNVYHTSADRDACRYDAAREVVAASADPAGWPQVEFPGEWQWQPVTFNPR